MPRVKLDYVVSFSSEDPEHPANNLLQREVSKKKWLCKKGESSCSVVLQLPRTVKITGVHIGAHHAALVEVLVSRSETSSEQFQVLIPSSVFISREESRRDAPVVRVRSFVADALSAPAREQRWDRVRLVCSQPHNKHCQFGLSFVHIDEAEGASCGAVPPRLLSLDALSSDEDDFKPGELFAKHLQNTSGEIQTNTSSNTGAQIRQATSQALKNIHESSTKLLKTPISKPAASRAHSPPVARCDRARDVLLYTRRDAEPHERIDRVLSRHERDKEHDHTNKTTKNDNTDQQNNTNQKTKDDSKTKVETKIKNETKTKDDPKGTPKRNKSASPPRPQRNYNKPTTDQNKEVRKRRRSSSQEQPILGLAPGPVSAVRTLLRGCVLVLSGYRHPRRAAVRALAQALGARVQRDWGPEATHLICAFPNTPKLRQVRAAAGPAAPVARADWLEAVRARRRLLPWRWYATERAQLVRPARALLSDDDPQPTQLRDDDDPQPTQLRDDDDPQPTQLRDDDDPQPDIRHTHHDPDSDGDTDDEIEKVIQAQKKRGLTESKTNHDAHNCADSPVATTSDVMRTVSRDTEDEVSTDEEGAVPGPLGPAPPGPAPPGPAPPGPALPDFFDGLTFAIDAAGPEARLMSRYVRAYGGLVLEMSEVAAGSEVDYIVRGRSSNTRHVSDTRYVPDTRHMPDTRHVSAAWLASCHDAQARLPHEHTLTKHS